MQRWVAPPNPLLKINVDAAAPNGRPGGVGVIVRDSLGLINAAGYWPILFEGQAHEMEALATYYGLNFAKECCFREVILESDNLEVIKALKQGTPNQTCFGSFIADTLSLLGNFRNVSFSHVMRKGNKVDRRSPKSYN
ncbi:hypothetical protein PIB30_068328 [Stylosanthes scabra]|uniref:RNase H type-1 domain-containing protein n=1 Tax=Stylosanthes scabra TaxID=79078 RepID=A0ABU6VPN7_9FABA|nr:hypothetical protein [Stylosanthes scabra]